MFRLVNKLWVKNVNNQRTVDGKTSVRSSTYLGDNMLFLYCKDVQTEFIHHESRLFYAQLSTYILYSINLLFQSFTHNPQYLLLNPRKKK